MTKPIAPHGSTDELTRLATAHQKMLERLLALANKVKACEGMPSGHLRDVAIIELTSASVHILREYADDMVAV